MELDNLSILRAVFDSTADGLLIVGNDGKIIEFNSRFSELWKIPLNILETKNDEKVLNFILGQLSNPEKFLAKVMELYKNQDAISHDTIEFSDGRFFERYSRPLQVENVTVGRVWSFRDVTAQKKSQELFAAITDLSPDIISIIDAQGVLVYNSAAAERIHGYDKDELIGMNTTNLIHEDDREIVSSVLGETVTRPGTINSVQYRYKNKDGSFSWMEATASNQIQNPQIQGVVVISREINKRKQLENDLSEALRLRDDFISMATHELKTPISSIKLQLQMLKRSKKSLSDRTTATSKVEDIDGLIDQVHTLQRLIDDLLNVSRIRTGKLVLEPEIENLSLLVETTVHRFRPLFKNAGCELEVNIKENIFLLCDKVRMEQVLVNLFSNTIKYAPGTLVQIELSKNEKFAEFKIKDHGMGVSANKLESIFGLFERGVHENYASGLGVGLFISRSIIEGHRGTISVESTEGNGATFILKLPV